MDSEHRHELKTNELADWIAHAPQFFRDNAKTVAAVVLVVAAVIVGKVGMSMKTQGDTNRHAEMTALIGQAEGDKLMALQSPDDLTIPNTIVETADKLATAAIDSKPASAALAHIKQGNAIRSQLHYNPAQLAPDAIASAVTDARQAYEKAIKLAEEAVNKNELTAMAQMGLGLCAEEIGDIEQAKKIYNAIAADIAFEGTVFPTQATLRLETIEDSQGSFTFVDAPEPVIPEFPSVIDPAVIDSLKNQILKPQEDKTEETPVTEDQPAPATETDDTSETTDDQPQDPAGMN